MLAAGFLQFHLQCGVVIGFDPLERALTRAGRGLDVADAGKVFARPVLEFEDDRFAYLERRRAIGVQTALVKGRPPLRDRAKQQVTLRIDSDVLAKFREGGPGWQGRINAALRVAVGL